MNYLFGKVFSVFKFAFWNGGNLNLLYKGWERRCRLYLELKPGGMDEGEK
jgi:hypothetical protein